MLSAGLTALFVGTVSTGLAQSRSLPSSSSIPVATAISPPAPDQLFVFGDSLSDAGNLFQVSRGRIPSSPPYANGRFTNGPIWIETVGEQFQLNPTLLSSLSRRSPEIPADGINFALGGATSGNFNLQDGTLPGLPHQLNAFLRRLQGRPANTKALYVVWIGGNDYIGETSSGSLNLSLTVSQTIAHITGALESLLQAGAVDILVFNLPDLGKTPFGLANNSSYLTSLTQLHNRLLSQVLPILSQKYPSSYLQLVDVNTMLNTIIQDPSSFGLTNVTTACLNVTTSVVCSNPDQYLFWDDLHPTRVGHRLIAQTALQVLQPGQPVASVRLQPSQIGLAGSGHRFLPIGLHPGIGKSLKHHGIRQCTDPNAGSGVGC